MPALSHERRAPSSSAGDTAAGPFVGPGPFTEAHRDLFFGRDADVARLRALLRTERIVVLHSPSGAGKTSLIQAGLVPRLRDEDDFRIFPTIRVGQELPEAERAPAAVNRYVLSAIHSLESGFARAGETPGRARGVRELLGIRLGTYFEHRSAVGGRESDARLLIFDQFEEIFTRSPHDHRARIEFFTDLAKVLHDRSVWALFAMREEYVAALDRYKRLLPAQLAARFHLDLLTPAGARQAISRPAAKGGVTVRDDALDLILGDLAEAGPGEDRSDLGAPIIDPLHLQLLCVDLWKELPADAREVDDQTIRRLRAARQPGTGDLTAVDWALLRYYDQTLRRACEKALEKTGPEAQTAEAGAEDPGRDEASEKELHELERRVRYWIDDHLIEAERYRRQTIAEKDDPLLQEVQAFLENAHILRASVRIGSKWYEIAHDRMVRPLRWSNDRWYQLHHDWFQHMARRYHEEKYPQQFDALPPRQLADEGYGRDLDDQDLAKLQEHERRYLEFCRRQARKKRRRVALSGLALVIGALAVWPLYSWFLDKRLEELAQATQELADVTAQRDEIAAQVRARNQELVELEGRRTTDRKRGRIQRVYSSAMTQRYRFDNHDVAMLLTRLALEENDDLPDRSRDSTSWLASPFWAAVEADPFSQTVSRDVLGGAAISLAAAGRSFQVTVSPPGDPPYRLVEIDPVAHRLDRRRPCRAGIQAFSPDRRRAAVVGRDLELVELADGGCETVARAGGQALRAAAPVWSPDQNFLAAFLADGGLAVYRVGRAGLERLEPMLGKRLEDGDPTRGGYAITSAAFHGDLLAAGDAGGGVRFVDLAGSGAPRELSGRLPELFTVWEESWPYGETFGHPRSSRKDAGIVALDFLSIRGPATEAAGSEGIGAATGKAETWLCLVHRGSQRTKGGKIFLHRLADLEGPRYELIADPASKIREGLLRELGRVVERPGGESFESASFSNDRTWLVTAGAAGTVTRWNLADLAFAARVFPAELGHLQTTVEIAGTWQVAEVDGADSGELRLRIAYPVARGRRDLLRGARGRVAAVAVTDDGEHVAAIQQDAKVRLWHFGGLSVAYRSQPWGEVGYVYDLAFDAANRLVTTDNRGRVQSWSVRVEPGGGCGDGTGSGEGPMQLCLDREDLFQTRLSSTGGNVSILSLDLRDDLLVVGTGDWVPRLLDPAGPKPEIEIQDGRGQVSHKTKISAVALRPGNPELAEDHDLATGDQAGALILWDLPHRSSEPPAPIRASTVDLGGSGHVTALAFHPAGRWLAVARLSGTLDLVDMTGAACGAAAPGAAGEPRPCVARSAPASFGEILDLAFNADGDRLAAGGEALSWWPFEPDGLLLGEEQPVPGAAGPLLAIAFVPGEGATVATTAGDSVQFWTLEKKSWPVELRGRGVELQSLAFSPDGSLLAAGDSKGRFMVWDLDVAKYVCRLTMRDLTPVEWQLNAGGMERRKLCDGRPGTAL